MPPLETIRTLAAFERRGPGTDAERRAARWLAAELISQRQRVRIETFWCRPNWALAHAWHAALALVGSLLSPSHPTVGAILLAIALVSTVLDELAGISLGRRLTPERASQNIVSTHRRATAAPSPTTKLIITANYDAGRTALVYRDGLRRATASLRRLAGPLALGWIAWLSIAIVWLLAVAVVRSTLYHSPGALGVIQLPPTVALLLGLALLLEASAAAYGPAAGDNASGSAVGIALTRVLAATPSDHLDIELVLAGAGEGGNIGLRRYLRAHGRTLKRVNAVVLAIGPCGSGQPHYWFSDGRLIPLRYARPLRELAARTRNSAPHRGRGSTAAFPARARGLAAIAAGSLDQNGLVPRSHQPSDTPDDVDQTALDQAVEFALLLVNAINASVGSRPAEPAATPA